MVVSHGGGKEALLYVSNDTSWQHATCAHVRAHFDREAIAARLTQPERQISSRSYVLK